MDTLSNLLHSRGFQLALGCSATVAGLAVANHLYKKRKYSKAKKFWDSQLEDVVILHQFPRGATTLSLSPFPIKVETFLRVNNIKYINDFEYPYSPDKHKSPWITINAEDISDSQLAIEFLSKKFGIEMGSGLSPKDKAVARSMRILMEDHLYWILMVERYVHHEARHLKDLVRKLHSVESIHSLIFERYRRMATSKMSIQTQCQGLGRHNKGDLQRMGIEDLQSISSYLGSKTYMLGGDKPSDLDAVVFGFMCFILYSSPQDSVFKTLVEKRLTNLFQHTRLIKSKYYPDWDELIQNSSLPALQTLTDPEAANQAEPTEVKEVPTVEEPIETAAAVAATVLTAVLPSAGEKVKTPVRKNSTNPSTPARKLSSAAIERGASTPVKKSNPALNGSDKKDNQTDQTAKPRPTTLNPSQSPLIKRAPAPAKPATTTTPAKTAPTTAPAKSTPVTKNAPATSAKPSSDNSKPVTATTPMSPISPVSPMSPNGATPKSTADSSRKSSITSTPSSKASSFSQNSTNKAKVITNGASNVLKSMLGRKK